MTTASSLNATRQSLAHGPLGTALLHIERAHHGTGPWHAVHSQLATIGPLIAGAEANLFLGAPAMTYVLHLAAADSDRYADALHTLDTIVATHTRRRLDTAQARIDAGTQTSFAEYDLLRGLTGLGALLLRRAPEGEVLKGVLEYLVRLTEPITGPDGRTLPGWWVWHGPTHLDAPTAGGHANAGLAHGIAGPLALLALAARRGTIVPGHHDAMFRICRWLDRIRQRDHHGTRWPRWITATTTVPTHPAAPSWCYGTPGLARAQQLAALALGDPHRNAWPSGRSLRASPTRSSSTNSPTADCATASEACSARSNALPRTRKTRSSCSRVSPNSANASSPSAPRRRTDFSKGRQEQP